MAAGCNPPSASRCAALLARNEIGDTTTMASASLLQKVAAHEINLLANRDEADQQARKVVDGAHEKAAALLQEAHNTLDAEIAARRRAAAAKRIEERQAIEAASKEKVARIRTESVGRLDGVRKALLSQIVPD